MRSSRCFKLLSFSIRSCSHFRRRSFSACSANSSVGFSDRTAVCSFFAAGPGIAPAPAVHGRGVVSVSERSVGAEKHTLAGKEEEFSSLLVVRVPRERGGGVRA